MHRHKLGHEIAAWTEIVEMIEYLRDRGCEWGDVMYHAVRVSESGESASEDSLVV